MKEDSRRNVRRLVPSIIAFIVFLIPFIVRANYPLDLAIYVGVLKKIPDDEGARSVLSAIIVGVPYFLSVGLWYSGIRQVIDRLTIGSRLEAFAQEVRTISSYKAADEFYSALKRTSSYDVPKDPDDLTNIKNKSGFLLIDFLISDLRVAVGKLCLHPDIRVSVYMEGIERDDMGTPVNGNVLVKIASSEFGEDTDSGIVFPRGRGFCGVAWEKISPQSGTLHPFPFPIRIIDKRFYPGSPVDERRSFLCVPVKRNIQGSDVCIAVVSIDSTRKYDFLIGSHLRSRIDFILNPAKNRIKEYVDLLV